MTEKPAKNTGCLLPVSRIKTIMKSSPDVANIGQESLFLVAKATELFIAELAKQTWKAGDDKTKVIYNTLSKIVNEDETLQFLEDTIPKKILARDYIEQMTESEPDSSESDSS